MLITSSIPRSIFNSAASANRPDPFSTARIASRPRRQRLFVPCFRQNPGATLRPMAEQNKSHPVQWTRRSFCARALAGTAVGVAARALKGASEAEGDRQPGFIPGELHAMEATAAAFMRKYHVPGLSVAIAREGRLVYTQGFGLAFGGQIN